MDQNFLEFCSITWSLTYSWSLLQLFRVDQYIILLSIVMDQNFLEFCSITWSLTYSWSLLQLFRVDQYIILLSVVFDQSIYESMTYLFRFMNTKISVCPEIRTRVSDLQGRHSTIVPQRHTLNVLLIVVYIV